MGIAVDTAQQQPYNPVAALTRHLNQRNNPTAREQRESSLQRGTMSSVRSLMQHAIHNREMQSPLKIISIASRRISSGTYYPPVGTRKILTRNDTPQVLHIRTPKGIEESVAEVR
jgi:hypothetical protein